MAVCWVIPGMPLFWKPQSGAVVAAVGRVPTPVSRGGITGDGHVSVQAEPANTPPPPQQLRRYP